MKILYLCAALALVGCDQKQESKKIEIEISGNNQGNARELADLKTSSNNLKRLSLNIYGETKAPGDLSALMKGDGETLSHPMKGGEYVFLIAPGDEINDNTKIAYDSHEWTPGESLVLLGSGEIKSIKLSK